MGKVGPKEAALRSQRESAKVLPFQPKTLSPTESSRLTELCGVVRAGLDTYMGVGFALLEIRDSRLYREKASTFEAFVQVEFKLSRAHAYRQIAAAETVQILSPMGDKAPENERQVRAINRLPKSDRPRAWKAAVKDAAKAGGKVTAEIVKAAVDRIAGTNGNGKPPADDVEHFDLPTELARLSKENDQLRGTIESLSTGKPEKEIAKLQDRLGRMDGRLAQEIKTREEAEKQAKYSSGLLQKIRAALRVTENKAILEAIADLKR